MRVIVCNDLHLKPAANDYDLEAISAPADAEVALVAGDLTHRNNEDDIALARRFVERLAPETPVFYVPGNHDHTPMPERVVDEVEHATDGHEGVVDAGPCTFVGWGCQQRSLEPLLDQSEFPALDPRTAPRGERRYIADETADSIEDACLDVVAGNCSAFAAADCLDIADGNRGAFRRAVAQINETYDHLIKIIGGRSDVVVISHLSPFNTSFDRHHSTGTRDEDRDGFHTGSIPVKLATQTQNVFATISGHSHSFGYETGTGDATVPHMLNLGYRGLGVVDINPEAGVFSFEKINTL